MKESVSSFPLEIQTSDKCIGSFASELSPGGSLLPAAISPWPLKFFIGHIMHAPYVARFSYIYCHIDSSQQLCELDVIAAEAWSD